MTRRKRKRKPRPGRRRAASDYERCLREADQALARNDVEIREDNWQELALEWYAPEEPERGMLAGYIAEHEGKLGIAWAREVLRMEVIYQSQGCEQTVAHYDRAFSRYPRCGLIEMWVAHRVFRCVGDFWRARQMYHHTIEQLPDHPQTYYEMGFMSYLLGDFPAALSWFDEAVERATEAYPDVAAPAFYNRGVTRYQMGGDKQAAIADVKEALRRKPDYVQAKRVLSGFRSKREVRFVPW